MVVGVKTGLGEGVRTLQSEKEAISILTRNPLFLSFTPLQLCHYFISTRQRCTGKAQYPHTIGVETEWVDRGQSLLTEKGAGLRAQK